VWLPSPAYMRRPLLHSCCAPPCIHAALMLHSSSLYSCCAPPHCTHAALMLHSSSLYSCCALPHGIFLLRSCCTPPHCAHAALMLRSSSLHSCCVHAALSLTVLMLYSSSLHSCCVHASLLTAFMLHSDAQVPAIPSWQLVPCALAVHGALRLAAWGFWQETRQHKEVLGEDDGATPPPPPRARHLFAARGAGSSCGPVSPCAAEATEEVPCWGKKVLVFYPHKTSCSKLKRPSALQALSHSGGLGGLRQLDSVICTHSSTP
jgi:hypothetical protein